MKKLIAGLAAMVFVVTMTFVVAQASDEATDVKVTPVVVEDIHAQYGDSQFAWHRIRTDKFQFETNDDGDLRFGVRRDLAKGVHARLLAKLHGTDLTEVRPEIMLYKGDWYTYISVGVNTKNGAASLYDETVVDFAKQDNWKFGLGLVHNGGLSGQKSTINLGPHFNVQLAKDLNLDLHYGFALTKNTSNEMWAIVKLRVR